MKKVYVDISEFMKIEAITGIQRVMREILVRLVKCEEVDTILLSYSNRKHYFEVIDNQRFIQFFEREQGSRQNIFSNTYIKIEDMEPESIFFDLDVAWSATLKRSYLLPILKKKHIAIVAQIYDIMAITHFQYFMMHFTYEFMEFIAAHILYADKIIVSTKASLLILQDFVKEIGAHPIDGVVAHLGADFQQKSGKKAEVQKKVSEIVKKGKFILMVGTIEPRKNHELVLKAFDKGLDKLGYNLIFAGRIGWKNEQFLENMRKHKQYEKRIFHISNASNSDIDYLYQHAFLVAFPTHMEGFGLPLVESLERGTPVLATDIDVLREIGQEYCYYFRHNSVEDFVACVKKIERNKADYAQKKKNLLKYKPTTWDQSFQIMKDTILSVGEECNAKI